ncbi:hypothetical protein GCM10011342_18880 [Aquisalinus flavus]|uniref:Uncharacterized protein n=2 Tax=Aquisalinus flavus TaxID=1526572 RepID=A0A8J2V692_9PROT|nr:hypothetical protein GCM10011342_18880 [Aquisalinus flavus]
MSVRAQFIDGFDTPVVRDETAEAGWLWMTGDGAAVMDMVAQEGSGLVTVDARADRRNIWWALIKRGVSDHIDSGELARPDRELRIEARIRLSHAPRRVNLHANHSRTTDFHSHLMEYDIPDTDWHEISFTTTGFDARPGDRVYTQIALMDWGREEYQVEIDWFRVAVVDPAMAEPDKGSPIPYRPATPALDAFAQQVPVAQDAIIDSAWPWVAVNDWRREGKASEPLLSVSGSQTSLLTFDLSDYAGKTAQQWGVLALYTDSVYKASTDLEEFGELRVKEVFALPDGWQRGSITWNAVMGQTPPVINGQMMIDVPPVPQKGAVTLIPVSPPVLQRLIDGKTSGLAIEAQGAISATFRSSQAREKELRPVLYFNMN